MLLSSQGVTLRHQYFDNKFARVFVQPDGSCLFHSLAYALNIDNMQSANDDTKQETGHALRQWLIRKNEWNLFADHCQENSGDRPMPYDEARQTTTFVDEYVLNFVSKRLGISLLIVQGTTFIYDTNPQSPVCIMVAYHDKLKHYEPIVSLEGLCCPDDLYRETMYKTLGTLFPRRTELDKVVDNIFSTNYRGVFLRTEPIVGKLLFKN